ncbi:hypothetical protein SDC9_121683 [bioreactor metagenome]|uniref:Uncharacterized protein n=1 Tax=bioreactor metagenome TaxID=1076179 RepID=A0A645CCP2_9ZZZZ
MQARLCLLQVIIRPAGDDDFLMTDIGFQYLVQPDLHRTTFIDCDHIEIIVHLQIRIFEQIIENPLCICLFFQFNYNLESRAIRFIPHFSDSFNFTVNADFIHPLHKRRFIDVIRNLRNDDLLFAATNALYGRARTDNNFTFSGSVCILQAFQPLNDCSGREVRSFNIFHERFELRIRMIDQVQSCIDDFA